MNKNVRPNSITTASLDYLVFKKAMINVCKVVEKRNAIQVLDTVLIKATTNGVIVCGTDLDTYTSTFVPGNVSKDFVAVVDAHKLKATMDKVKDTSNINFARSESNLTASIGKLNLNLKQDIPVDDFPESTTFRDKLKTSDTCFTVQSSLLLDILSKIEFAISSEETRYYLNGIYMHVSEGSDKLRFVTTDGHRLARYVIDLPQGAKDIPGVIIPRKAALELMRLLKRKDCPEETMITVVDTGVSFMVGEDEILETKVIDGTFPDYQRVIPINNDHNVTADPSAFIEAVKQASSVLSADSKFVMLNLTPGLATLVCRDREFGEAFVDVSVQNEQSLEIGFNYRYLIDVLAHIDGSVTFHLNDAASPTILTGSDNHDLTYVLMPLRP